MAQSDYAANAYTENVQQTTKKSAVTNGKTIGDPQLSEKAQKYYEQLKKKFSNMDFILVSTYENGGENTELVIYKKR